MQTILYVSLTADGRVATGEGGGIPPVVLGDLMGAVAKAGAMVIGRATYELFRGLNAIGSVPGVVMVVSTSLGEAPGVAVAASPQAALDALSAQGLSTAVIGGGPKIYDAFLALGLVDEARINIVPQIVGRGPILAELGGAPLPLDLISARVLGDGIAQLHYRRVG